MNRSQGKAYAALTLDLLYKMKITITPEVLAKQMDIIYDLYDENQVEKEYEQILENNKIFNKGISGRANTYIVNIFDSATHQKQSIEKFCKGTTVELGKIYVTPPGQNSEKYYELIRDIRNKSMDVLIITIFSLYSMSSEEWAIIVKLCRENEINIVEI